MAPPHLTDGLILAIDTSTAATSVAVVAGARAAGPAAEPAVGPMAERVEVAANRHGELLAPLVRSCLREAGATVADVALVAVGNGPGPFTGLRVGLVTARALGAALGVEVRGACSLDVIAAAHRGRPIAAVTDARRREAYWATYDATGRRIRGPAVDRPGQLATALRLAGGPVPLLAGAGALLHREALVAAGGFEVSEADPYPRAALLAALALDPAVAGPARPLYLRRPDAQPPARRKQVTPA
ncbi:MAG: tRNA (adenosine(37)-N6)-threonylcarbamoyltransferase complex dimerization subunit type 1 TsaB [Frankiaceae bacterium]